MVISKSLAETFEASLVSKRALSWEAYTVDSVSFSMEPLYHSWKGSQVLLEHIIRQVWVCFCILSRPSMKLSLDHRRNVL